MISIAAKVAEDDLSLLFILIALICLGAAGYLAYLRNFLGCALLVLVAIVAVYIGS